MDVADVEGAHEVTATSQRGVDGQGRLPVVVERYLRLQLLSVDEELDPAQQRVRARSGGERRDDGGGELDRLALVDCAGETVTVVLVAAGPVSWTCTGLVLDL